MPTPRSMRSNVSSEDSGSLSARKSASRARSSRARSSHTSHAMLSALGGWNAMRLGLARLLAAGSSAGVFDRVLVREHDARALEMGGGFRPGLQEVAAPFVPGYFLGDRLN